MIDYAVTTRDNGAIVDCVVVEAGSEAEAIEIERKQWTLHKGHLLTWQAKPVSELLSPTSTHVTLEIDVCVENHVALEDDKCQVLIRQVLDKEMSDKELEEQIGGAIKDYLICQRGISVYEIECLEDHLDSGGDFVSVIIS